MARFMYVVIITSFLALSGCASYSKAIQKAVEKTYKRDFPSYTFRGSPVGNFGVGTMYEAKVAEVDTKKYVPGSSWLLAHPNSYA